MKFEFLLNIDNTIPRGERIKTDFRRLAFEVIRDTLKVISKDFYNRMNLKPGTNQIVVSMNGAN